jgi:hypothetical protein
VSGSEDDRRQHRRYRLWVPARIEGESDADDGGQLAIGHDISQKGSLMVTRAPGPEVGSTIRIFVRVPPDAPEERMVRARVLRATANQNDPNSMWPIQIAVEFDEADPEIERIIAAYAADEGVLPKEEKR